MAVSEEFKEFTAELFGALGPIRIKNMFGGAGVYAGELFFAIIADEKLYMKVDDENRAKFEAEGLSPFVYDPSKGERGTMSYYELPDAAYDDPDEACEWARSALDAALRAARKKRPKKKAAKISAAKTKTKAAPQKAAAKKTPAANPPAKRKRAR